MELLPFVIIFFAAGGAIFSLIATIVQVKRHRPVKIAANANIYMTAAGVQMDSKEDSFLRTHTVRIKVSSPPKK